MISVIVCIFNKESIIGRIVKSLFNNSSDLVKEYIFVLDGCTDNSPKIIIDMVKNIPPNTRYKIIYTDDIFEIRSNNIGIKNATQKYVCIVQDDMEIIEKKWDKRLIQPFLYFNDIFAITSRSALQMDCNGHFFNIKEGPVGHNCFKKENYISRDIVYINQMVNRGPLMMDLDKVKQLNYLDETLPGLLAADDHDLCVKAFQKYGWKCGSYWIQYNSPLDWGSTRTGKNSHILGRHIEANIQELARRYRDFFINWDPSKNYEERYLKDNNPDGYIK
jgi:glycosyltransferase involved in cell wall biosynthesis